MFKDLPHFEPDNLIAGEFPIVTKLVWFKEGCKLKRGSIVCHKVSLGEEYYYDLLDGSIIGKVVDNLKDISPFHPEGPLDKVADLAKEEADIALLKVKNPVGVLMEDIDCEHGDKQGVIWLTGVFNKKEIHIGEGLSMHAVEKVLRDSSIFLKEVY